jgi:hypothetical protein
MYWLLEVRALALHFIIEIMFRPSNTKYVLSNFDITTLVGYVSYPVYLDIINSIQFFNFNSIYSR